ncbi:MAG: polyprenyl synthetase family protein [Chloroflexi bacterium]|nr:polyprenyl synthetase family protein [Chloroflexota bacterium]
MPRVRFLEYLADCRPLTDEEMRRVVGEDQNPVTRVARYHLGWTEANGTPITGPSGGKQLRAGLLLLACEALGGGRAGLPAAAAIELFHAMTLLHDDIMDRDRQRRGRPAAWTIWGEATAINAGDLLLTRAFAALAEFGADPTASIRRMADACGAVIRGQQLDLQFETRSAVSASEYEQMIALKTATLFGLALEMGAVAAGCDSDPWRRLGHQLGLAFQMRDDALGIWGDPQVTGKPAGGDLRRGKKSLPVVLYVQAGGQIPATVATDEDVRTLLDRFDEAGVASQMRERLTGIQAHCRDLVGGLAVKKNYAQMLDEMVDLVADRDY